MCVISNTNFHNIKDYERCNNYSGVVVGYKKENDHILIYSKQLASSCICVYKDDSTFAIALSINELEKWADENHVILDPYNLDTDEEIMYNRFGYNLFHFKKQMKKESYKNVEYISNWSEIRVYESGYYEVIQNSIEPYSKPIIDNYDLFKAFLKKYKNIVDRLIDDGKFIPTITGGVDSRGFIGFYKDRINDLPYGHSIYLKSVKNDGKNNVELGIADMNIANEVAKRIGMYDVTFTENKLDENHITLSGMYIENSQKRIHVDNKEFLVNDPDYIYKYIQRGNIFSQMRTQIMPFIDDMYLSLDHPGHTVMKCLIPMLIVPELLDIPIVSTDWEFSTNGYMNFYNRYKGEIEIVKMIMDIWGEDKCKNILK